MTLSLSPTGEFTEASSVSSLGPQQFSSPFLSVAPSQSSCVPPSYDWHASSPESYDGLSTQGSTESSNKAGSQTCNLYVASLPPTFTDADLYELFVPFGPIVSAKAMCKKGVKECKGYGFVLFRREEDAVRAQSAMIGHVIGNSKIQVRRARGGTCSPMMERQHHASTKVSASHNVSSTFRSSGAAMGEEIGAVPLQAVQYAPMTYFPQQMICGGVETPFCVLPTAPPGPGGAPIVYMMLPSAVNASAAPILQ